MKTVGLVVNLSKPNAAEVAHQLISLLEGKGASVLVDAESATKLGLVGRSATDEQFVNEVEMAFVLGGDGTLLGVARALEGTRIPILGINLGHLGFLSEAEPGSLVQAVGRVFSGDYCLEERLMLATEIERQGSVVVTGTALNDIGVAKGSFARMVTLSVYVDDMFVDTYSGDGCIISTPTGSTAYSLSCGGPIVSPHLNVMIITPICPHQLNTRPIVLSHDQMIRIEVQSTHNDIGLTIDGQVGHKLEVNDIIKIRKAVSNTVLVKWQERGFFDVLRRKLHHLS
ncbi:MAG: kinase [Bacilli bacterium]|nr:kinase [Bacilli bacterium]